MTASMAYRLNSLDFVRAYVTTMRPYLLFVSGITGIAGMSIAPDITGMTALMIFIATFLSYGFGQALTDCFQIDTDTISSPYRPLTQGTVTRTQMITVSIIGLAICVTILAALNPWNLLLGALAAGGLATYTPFKRKWWGGPWYNAWIVGLLGFMAFLSATAGRVFPLPDVLVWTLSAIFFGYSNFVLAGYFKDISADARSNYNTFPVAFGRKKAAAASSILASLAIVSMIAARSVVAVNDRFTLAAAISWGFLIAAIAAASTGQYLLHRVTRDEKSHTAISLVVHAYILGLASIATAAQPGWAALVVLFCLLFILVLEARPSRSQI
jgi:4-hydroxybenzoate polyprenyltransferase